MDIRDKVKRVLKKKKGELPWELGVGDSNGLSETAISLWELLDTVERLIISRDNPFKDERDKEIYFLNRIGIPQNVLIELTGIGRSSLNRAILKQRMKHREKWYGN